MTIIRWSPDQEIQSPIRRTWDDLFRGFNWRGSDLRLSGEGPWEPNVDVYETADDLVIRAELPGMKRDDIELRIENGSLTICGKREADTETTADNYHRLERRFGRFSRAFVLPTLVDEDKVRANYEDGVLTVRLPKAESAKPRRIQIAA